jgi:hypothetical protein
MATITPESEITFKKLIQRTQALQGVGQFERRPELEEFRIIVLRTLRRLEELQDKA